MLHEVLDPQLFIGCRYSSSNEVFPSQIIVDKSNAAVTGIMYHKHSPTGSKTLLQSFDTSSKNGSSIDFPKNLNSNAGVKKIPAILLITVLHSDVATFPPDADVRMIHMLIVVGRQVKIKSPSSNGLERSDGASTSNPFVTGTPTKNGQTPNVMSWMRPFNFKFAAAFVSSASLRLSPESKNIMVTPYFPMKSSGLSILPFFPSCALENKSDIDETSVDHLNFMSYMIC